MCIYRCASYTVYSYCVVFDSNVYSKQRCGDRELIENVQAFAFNHFLNVDVNAYNADFWGDTGRFLLVHVYG